MTQPNNQQTEVEALKAELQYRDFLAEYQKAGGILSEPDPLTGQTRQNRIYQQAKHLMGKGEAIPDLVNQLATSEGYCTYFSDTPTNTQQPSGRTVPQKDFQAGKVPMEDIVSGKIRVAGK